jgi:DNA-directed RNA polymerase alpha subunit
MSTDRQSQLSKIQMTISSMSLSHCKLIYSWLENRIKQLENDMALYNMTIQDLGLSTRAYNILRANKIDTINQLLTLTSDWNNARMLTGVGATILKEMQQKISEIQQLNYPTK